MKSTFISILVGALAGMLLTVGSSLHASHAAASQAKHESGDVVAPAQSDRDIASDSAVPPVQANERSTLQR